jgi:hypothetical protein
MKLLFLCLVLLGIGLAPSFAAQPVPDGGTNTVAGLLAHTECVVLTLRSNATAELRRSAARPVLTTNDLVELRNALCGVRSSLLRADIALRLGDAEARVQKALATAASRSPDPEDSVLVEGLDLGDFHSRIEAQKARAGFLQHDLDRLMGGLNRSLEVAAPLQDILSQADLSRRLAARLNRLLAEWEKSTPKPGTGLAGLTTMGAPDASPAANRGLEPGAISAPPNVAKIVRMGQAGVDEQVILGFITSLDEPFGLATADQILQAHQAGLNDRLIIAILRHDSLLQARAAHPMAPRRTTVSGSAQPR